MDRDGRRHPGLEAAGFLRPAIHGGIWRSRPAEAGDLIHQLGLGELQSMQGCAGGIENTNYFVSTGASEYVLTLFERLSFEQLPFYLALMKHLPNAWHPGA